MGTISDFRTEGWRLAIEGKRSHTLAKPDDDSWMTVPVGMGMSEGIVFHDQVENPLHPVVVPFARQKTGIKTKPRTP